MRCAIDCNSETIECPNLEKQYLLKTGAATDEKRKVELGREKVRILAFLIKNLD